MRFCCAIAVLNDQVVIVISCNWKLLFEFHFFAAAAAVIIVKYIPIDTNEPMEIISIELNDHEKERITAAAAARHSTTMKWEIAYFHIRLAHTLGGLRSKRR